MKQFLVIGLGRFGISLATALVEKGHEVLGVDSREELVQNASSSITQAIQADATDEKSLRTLGVTNFDVAVVAIGQDIQASILCTLILKELGVKYIVAKAQNHLHGKVLSKTGADRVVFPERDMGVRVANNLVSTNLLDYIELSDDFSIMEITAPEFCVGKTLAQLRLPNRFSINVIAVKHGPSEINITPAADDTIEEGDIMVVVGRNRHLKRLEEH
ncbi:MAG: TrkA family potassium uptake protein [Firmicutes bacterium]|nr:TrkA family potassium uptake protein [Bacillota bacterium]